MGEESSSSGAELEAGELVIDDSYTHLSKKKKKSKKSKKKKDKEKDRDKEKSGKDKKHSKSFGGGLSFFFYFVFMNAFANLFWLNMTCCYLLLYCLFQR